MAAAAKRKQKKNSSKKKTSFISGKLVGLFIAVFFIIGVVFLVYQFRDGFLYYLGFKTNKSVTELSKEERKIADIRIYEVLSQHENNMFGFDVSQYQDKIDWENIGKVEDTFQLSFVFIRATAGKDKLDTKFKENWKLARKHNFIRGAYHYYRPNENSLQQADNFIKSVRIEKGDLPPVLDIEKLPKKQSLDSLKVGLRRWLTKVEKHYKMKPIIYSGESYYTDFLKKEFSDYPFWIANYNFWRKTPDDHWLIWQFTEKAKVNGIKGMIDLNVLNGDFVTLVELTKE